MKKVTKFFRAFFGLAIILFVAAIMLSAIFSDNSIGLLVVLFLLVVLPIGNIGYSMIFKKPEEGSLSPITLYTYGGIVAALGIVGIYLGEPLAIWSLGFSAACFQLARHKTKVANNNLNLPS